MLLFACKKKKNTLCNLSFFFFAKQIYDLSVDALSPMYYFLLPSSKIRDATFLFNEEGKSVIAIMSSAGYMYTQLMDESSSAQHGPFYVTNVLEITHEDLKVSKMYIKVIELYPQNGITCDHFNHLMCLENAEWQTAILK